MTDALVPVVQPKPRLLDQVRSVMQSHRYSRRTQQAYVAWIKRFIFYHDKRHPLEPPFCSSTRRSSRNPCRGWTTSCMPTPQGDSPSS